MIIRSIRQRRGHAFLCSEPGEVSRSLSFISCVLKSVVAFILQMFILNSFVSVTDSFIILNYLDYFFSLIFIFWFAYLLQEFAPFPIVSLLCHFLLIFQFLASGFTPHCFLPLFSNSLQQPNFSSYRCHSLIIVHAHAAA